MAEVSPNSKLELPSGRRGVTALLALAIVLFSWGLGVLLGVLFPLSFLVSHSREAAHAAGAHIPQSVVAKDKIPTGDPMVPGLQRPPESKAEPVDATASAVLEAKDRPAPNVQTSPRRVAKVAQSPPKERGGTRFKHADAGTREKYGAGKERPAAEPWSVSQIPIVGPVVGLLVP